MNRTMLDAPHARFRVPFSILDMASISTISIVLFLSISIASGQIVVSALIITWLMMFNSLVFGRSIFTFLPNYLNPSIKFPTEFVTGIAIIDISMLAFCISMKCSADVAFILTCAFGLVAIVFNAKRLADGIDDSIPSYGAICVICTFSVIWSWQAIWAVPRLRETYIFPAWQDFFFHSCMITEFAHFSDFGGTWIFAHGTKIPIYHYASYMLPAAISTFSNFPALALATAFTEPFSFIVMGLGAWVLGVVIAGRIGGAACIAAIFMLPDAAYYWFRNPYYDFHWLLQITPMGYGIGFSLLALALGIGGVRQRSAAAFWLAAALTLISASFKMQLFALLLLSGFMLVGSYWRPRKLWVLWACFASICIAAAGLIGVAELLPRAPHFLSTRWEPGLALQGLLPSGTISDKLPSVFAVPAGLAILLLTAFGGLLPAYIVGVAWSRNAKLLDFFDVVPLVFVLVYCFIVVTFPRNTGDEFQHRPFTLVYAVLAVWCACLTVKFVKATLVGRANLALTAFAFVLLPFPFLMQMSAQSGHHAADWMKSAARVEVPRGLFQSAEYIRQHASISDVTLKSSDDGDVPLFGYLTAISERASYVLLLRSHSAWDLWGTPLDVVAAREAVGRELLQAPTFEEFSQIAQAAGISWYVLSPPDHLPEAITDKAVMSTDGYFVLHVKPQQVFGAP
jgi:hypothetical protein